MLEATRLKQQKDMEQLRKERDDLRQIVAKSQEQLQNQLAEAEKKTAAEVTAAANVAFEQEMEKRRKEERQKTEEANAAIANAQRAAANAKLEAVQAAKRLAEAEARIQQQRNDFQQYQTKAAGKR